MENLEKNQIKTILVTGINGFLGSHIANKIASKYEVIGLGYSPENLKSNLELPFKVYSSQNIDIERIFLDHKIDAIIHTATVYQKTNDSFAKLIRTNILLPVQLLELANKHGVKLFLNTDTFFNQPNSNYSYLSYYTLSKRHFIDWRSEILGPCTFVTLKLFHLYGPNDRPSKFVPSVIRSLINNVKEMDLTEGEQYRDFIYVDDAVAAYTCVLDNYQRGIDLQKEYEVGTMKATSIKNFVELAKELSDSITKLNFGKLEYRENEIMYARANHKPLLKIGWKMESNLEKGLKETIRFYSKKN